MKIPVLMIAFNRPHHVKRTMETVRTYQPSRLYLACDGPRETKEGEAALVASTQQAMLDAVDWDCEVQTLFRNQNLGCAQGVYTAISWFFEHEPYGIIIEDDILVGQDFFKLCEDLLPRYQDNEKVMSISARNISHRTDINNSYVYSYSFSCWGWATWRRVWEKVDMSMAAARTVSPFYLTKRLGIFKGLMMFYYFKADYYQFIPFDTWDFRWELSLLMHDGLMICPGVNLAINIGTDGGAHYDDGDTDPYQDLQIGNIAWPLVYNDSLVPDSKQARYERKDFLRIRRIGLKKKLRKWFK